MELLTLPLCFQSRGSHYQRAVRGHVKWSSDLFKAAMCFPGATEAVETSGLVRLLTLGPTFVRFANKKKKLTTLQFDSSTGIFIN